MKPLSGFIASILLLAFFTPLSTQAQQKDCRKVDVTVDITHSSNGQKGSIKVSGKDSDATFMLHLLTMQRENQQTQITSGTINNIPPGDYELVIHYRDPKYCSETRKVTVN
jgi:hypothetical protein